MLNLAYPPEDVFLYDGIKHRVNLSFDNVLRLIDLMRDDEIPDESKVTIALKMLLGKGNQITSEDLQEQYEVFKALFAKFINRELKRPKVYDLAGNELPEYNEDTEQYYSLKQDVEYIYAGFMQAYGIDLIEQRGKLSWDKFQALLKGLPDDTKFKQVVNIRMWSPQEEKENYKQQMGRLKEFYKLEEE